jgi:pimeloyl-ACP methyl ester carboxylesterase
MPKVKVNDIHMYYETKGEGYPLVMIYGFGGNMDAWDPRLVEGLSKHFKLILFDHRGAGRTDESDREYTIRLFADDTVGLMDALGISKAHIFGVSMGGMIAQELAINYPERVSRLVLCSTSSHFSPDEHMSKLMSAMERDCSLEELTNLILSFPFAIDYPRDFLTENPIAAICLTSEFVKENPDLAKFLLQLGAKYPLSLEGVRRRNNAILRFNTQARLKNIKAPTLVLHGRKDMQIRPDQDGPSLAKAIPNPKIVIFEKSAHLLAEEMNEVARVITEFLL